ncbi:MAG: peptidoglycan DD-metalloendopeptidase family protein [Desulfohalobiaceae bacterium]
MLNSNYGMESGLQKGRQASGQAEMQNAQQRLQDLQESGGNRQELKQASKDFEALFIQKLWQQMRKTLPEDGMLRSGEQEKYMSMFDQEFSKKMAEAGGIGLSRMIMNSLDQGLDKGAQSAALSSSAPSWPEQKAPLLPEDLQSGQQGQEQQEQQEQAAWKDAGQEPMQRVEALAQEIVRRKTAVYKQEEEKSLEELQPAEGSGPANAAGTASMPELVSPVQGEISSEFGWRQDPFSGKKAWHSGVDYAAPEGSPVKACWGGEVVFSGENKGYGKQVVIKHDQGWQSVYAHNSENLVSPGDQVQAGQEIAKVGDSGRSTGPHLHFELKQGDMAWDPQQIEHRILAGLQVGRKA